MTTDLWMLTASAVLFFVLYFGQGFAVIKTIGPKAAAGNRETMPPMTGWKGRIDRAVANHSDNLIVFVGRVTGEKQIEFGMLMPLKIFVTLPLAT